MQKVPPSSLKQPSIMYSKLHTRMFYWFLAGALSVFAPLVVAKSAIQSPTIEEISILQTEPANHPLSLLRRGVFEGWARVSLAIDEEGKLIDALIVGYSHIEFGQATLDALHEWEFTPAKINGETVSSVTQLTFTYNRDSSGAAVIPVSMMEFIGKRFVSSQPEENKLVRLDQLDGIPVPLHIVSPAYSAKNAQDHTGEKVIVKFYIDEKGHVRLPTLKYADSPEIARQALAAVAQWRFQPPTYEGKPVITRASQEFRF